VWEPCRLDPVIQSLTPAVLLLLTQAPPSSFSGDELAAAASAVFATKCVQCHGPALPHPKAGFGYITDLRRLVDSGKYIVPGAPEKSEIWSQVSEGDMPPDGAKAGPLTQAEKDAILAWIVAGAPLPSEPPTDLATQAPNQPIVAAPPPADATSPRKIAIAQGALWLVGGYLAAGVAVGLAFVLRVVDRGDAPARKTPWTLRLLLVPCAAALWPVVLRWWVLRRNRRRPETSHDGGHRLRMPAMGIPPQTRSGSR
jgi:mono/diheme cytochrome c family protein